MSKLYRSMLWSGLVVAGVAACGDDVSIVQPPAPVLTVRSISVAPNGVTVGIGANIITMSAAVNADAGVTNLAVVWSTSDATKATVSQTGQVTTLAAGSVAIIACSQLAPSVCGNATLTISVNAPTVASVTVVPAAATIARGNTLQLVASVQGTNSPAQTVTWQPSPTPAIATVSATGLVTTTASSATGTVALTACSTVAGFTNVCGSSAITVVAITPASASISAINWVPPTGPTVCTQGPGPSVPVILTNVRCQIEVTANVNGGDQSLSRLDVVMTNTALGISLVVASQTFPGTLRADGDESLAAPVDITMSINTQQLRRPGGAGTPFIPAIFNGNNTISLNLYVVGSGSPLVFAATPLVMNNTDAILAPTTLVQTSSTPSFLDGGGTTWYTGTLSYSGAQYISFSTQVPTSVTFGSTICGTSTAAGSVTGTAATGLPIASTYACAGVEGSNSVTGAFTIVQATLVGPDGTAVTVPTVFSNVGSSFNMPANNASGLPPDPRWNLITPASPAPVLPGPVAIDNLGPTITANEIGFQLGCSATIPTPGCWIGSAYNLAADFTAVDAGSGVPVITIFNLASTGPTVCGGTVFTVATLAENTSPTAYSACATAVDALGNTSGAVAGFNAFGVDKTAPTIAFSGTYTPTSATPAEVNVLPAQNLNYNVQDNNSGLEITALTIAYVRTLNNGGVVSTTACAPAATYDDLAGAGTAPLSLITPVDLATFCTLPGENTWNASAIDRAGNTSATIVRAMEYNPAIPVINAINIIPPYAAAAVSIVDVLATDDEDLWSAEMWLHTTTNIGSDIRVIFGPKVNLFSGIWGADWDGSLFLATTLGTDARLTLPATYALAGYVESVALFAAGQAPTDTISVNVYDTFGAASGATSVALNAAFVTTASYSAAGSNPWSSGLGNVLSTSINTVGLTCNFEYSTPTNNPEVFTRIWVMNEAAGQYTLLADLNSQPVLISDNGIQRLYRYTLSGSVACANVGGTGVAANNIIAIKSNVGAIIF